MPALRVSPLSHAEVAEVVAIIERGRTERHAEHLPERLRSRDWGSVEKVVLALDDRLGFEGVGWKVGAASEDVRRAEGLPGPSPGRIYRHTVFPSGAQLPRDLFINYRNCECEFAFELSSDFPERDKLYTEADAQAGIEALLPALEIGDMVFLDWYGASGYFGTSLDNGGGAAFVVGRKFYDWRDLELPAASMDLYLNDRHIKSGKGVAAMGNPVTSLTWMLNWLREHGRGAKAGEFVSTGTCTGHLFAASGDTVRADFGPLGVVDLKFA